MLSLISHWTIRVLALGVSVLIVYLFHAEPFVEALFFMLIAAEFFAYGLFNASLHDRLVFGNWKGPDDYEEDDDESAESVSQKVIELDGYRR